MARQIQVGSLHCCVVEFFFLRILWKEIIYYIFVLFCFYFLSPVKVGCEGGGLLFFGNQRVLSFLFQGESKEAPAEPKDEL